MITHELQNLWLYGPQYVVAIPFEVVIEPIIHEVLILLQCGFVPS
jgi:hypothetical protein